MCSVINMITELFKMLFFSMQLWIDSSTGGTPAAPEKKEADFFEEHTQVGDFFQTIAYHLIKKLIH